MQATLSGGASAPAEHVVELAGPVEPSSSGEIVVVVAEDAEVSNAAQAGSSEPPPSSECVICLGEIDVAAGDPSVNTLICGHAFHAECISEWLSKDGRCPTCRRQIQEVASHAQRHGPEVQLPNDVLNRASMQSMAMLMLESRRLMMLATMEAALAVCPAPSPSRLPTQLVRFRPLPDHAQHTRSNTGSRCPRAALAQVLVMSYVSDPYLLSPALMLIAAAVTFMGASHYLAKPIAAARPLLGINGLYHVYLIAGIVHAQQGDEFFSENYGAARTVLLSLGCVTVMEVALPPPDSFALRVPLLPCPPAHPPPPTPPRWPRSKSAPSSTRV